MKTIQYDNPKPGCYVDESSGSADDCNRRTVGFAMLYGFLHELRLHNEEDSSQVLSETADEAIDYLNELETRSYVVWLHKDNSLFLVANVEQAREEAAFVSGGNPNEKESLCNLKDEYPCEDFYGEWLHISDHGNATLYFRENPGDDREIWSVV